MIVITRLIDYHYPDKVFIQPHNLGDTSMFIPSLHTRYVIAFSFLISMPLSAMHSPVAKAVMRKRPHHVTPMPPQPTYIMNTTPQNVTLTVEGKKTSQLKTQGGRRLPANIRITVCYQNGVAQSYMTGGPVIIIGKIPENPFEEKKAVSTN